MAGAVGGGRGGVIAPIKVIFEFPFVSGRFNIVIPPVIDLTGDSLFFFFLDFLDGVVRIWSNNSSAPSSASAAAVAFSLKRRDEWDEGNICRCCCRDDDDNDGRCWSLVAALSPVLSVPLLLLFTIGWSVIEEEVAGAGMGAVVVDLS